MPRELISERTRACWTPSSPVADFPWVQQELNAALMDQISGKGGVILPVHIEDCEIPPLGSV
jgi:hypothetical protein